MHNEGPTRALQARQLGLISAAQCHELGLSRKVIARQVAEGRWERRLPSVYADRLHPASRHQSDLAAVMWAGAGALVSHRAAGALFGFDAVASAGPELWVPAARSSRSGLVHVHRGEVEAVDR